jgi:predicted nucleotidyltransferase
MRPPVPESLIRSIVATYAPRRIVLFGSEASGMANADSDLDLLVVLDDDVPPEALSWRRRHDARKGYEGAVDIIPCREHVLAERSRAAGSFADTIVKQGVTVYERG